MSTCAVNTRVAAQGRKFWRTRKMRGVWRIATPDDLTQVFWTSWTVWARRINSIIAGTRTACYAKVSSKPCRAQNLKNCWTAWRCGCVKWAEGFSPAQRRLIRIARANRHRASIANIRPRAGLISGRTSIVNLEWLRLLQKEVEFSSDG